MRFSAVHQVLLEPLSVNDVRKGWRDMSRRELIEDDGRTTVAEM
jgi:hypothetical protein